MKAMIMKILLVDLGSKFGYWLMKRIVIFGMSYLASKVHNDLTHDMARKVRVMLNTNT